MEISEELLRKISEGRQYRPTAEVFRTADPEQESGKKEITGHACTFNEPYVLYDDGEFRIEEQIDSHAFDECDMSDVIMQYDHRGHVYARTRNNTLTVKPDNKGLAVVAELSGTEIGCQLFEEVKGGYTDRMSFGFTVAEDKTERINDHEENKITILRTITKVRKLYDVSCVSIPANDGTDISARGFVEGVIDKIKAERLARRAATEKLKAECLEILGGTLD